MGALGDVIVRFLREATSEVILVAPFIGATGFSQLVNAVPPGAKARVVTRWRPQDVLSGVSDLRALEICRTRGIPLFLRDDLHAKLYVVDNRCLVGSANITETALGWRTPSNLELLVPVSRCGVVEEFLEGLFQKAVLAGDLQRDRLQMLLDDVGQQEYGAAVTGDGGNPSEISTNWIPTIKTPEDLYALYSGDEHRVLRTAIEVTRAELRRFGVPSGLREAGFRSWIGAILAQTPIIERTISHIEDRRDMDEGTFRELLSSVGADTDEYPIRDRMRVLQRWLEYFFGGDFELVADSVRLVKYGSL